MYGEYLNLQQVLSPCIPAGKISSSMQQTKFTPHPLSFQLLAAPFAAGALFLPYPWCFISLIPSNVIGEMWIGVSTAIIVDLVPSKIRTTSIAVYLFIITVIGGNFNLLVPPLQQGFEKQMSDAASYRWSLFLTFPGLYALSAILFILTFFLMRVDLRRKKKMEEYLLVNSTSEEEEVADEEK